MSKPTEWPTSGASPTKSSALRAASAGLERALDVLVRDAVHLVADDRSSGVDEGRPLVGDLAALDADGSDLDEVGQLGIGAGGLDVDDDELATGAGPLGELEHGVGERLQVRQALGLADLLAQLVLHVDERGDRPVGEHDRLGHHVLGQDLDAGLDHHDRVAGAGHDQVELRLGELAGGRVEDELAVDPADVDRTDRALERDLADRECRRRGDRAQDVELVLLVRGQGGDDDLDVILVPLGEQRADRAGR